MLLELPTEILQQIFVYLEDKNIQQLARINKAGFLSVLSELIKRQQINSPSPPLIIGAVANRSFFYAPSTNFLKLCGENEQYHLGIRNKNPKMDRFSLFSTCNKQGAKYNHKIEQVKTVAISAENVIVLADNKETEDFYGCGSILKKTTLLLNKLPKPFSNFQHVSQLAVGGGSIFIKTLDNNLFAYGCNRKGQLGIGDKTKFIDKFVQITFLPNDTIEQIAVSQSHSLVLIKGELYGCGDNSEGQLGLKNLPNESKYKDTFTKIPHIIAVKHVVVNKNSTIIATNKMIYAGGKFFFQQPLVSSTNNILFTELGLPPGNILQIAIGGIRQLYLLVLTDKGLYGFGNLKNYTDLGFAAEPILESSFYQLINLAGTVQQISIGDEHILILTDRGLYGCGNNEFGQLGLPINLKMKIYPLTFIEKNPPEDFKHLFQTTLKINNWKNFARKLQNTEKHTVTKNPTKALLKDDKSIKNIQPFEKPRKYQRIKRTFF
jgi:alpha-tubulin suppressor-like RCC1 family protein